jgi:nuclear transport factor 2 (NTF2) superfamily protein
MKTPPSPSPSKTRSAGKRPAVPSRAGKQELNGLPGRVVEVDEMAEVEDIAREPQGTELPTTSVGLKVVETGRTQVTEDITQKAGPEQKNHPRLANGARIRQNRAYQRVQKIRAKKLVVPASDEMGYKKLFTKFEEGFLAQDIVLIGECLSPAFQWRLPNGDVVYGKKEALEEMERRFATPNGPKFSKAIWRFEGETVLQSYGVEYLGPDGRWRQSRGFDIYEIGNGLITLKDAYWKMIP